VVKGYPMFGVIRPGWDVEGGAHALNVDGHCFYFTEDGERYPGVRGWEGMQYADEGDRIGMLLDLDQGSMTVWKNNEKLGVMQAEGLTGPLCWAVSLHQHDSSARIESAPAPASPAEEELAAAKAWQRRRRLGLPQTAMDAECDAAEAAEAEAAARKEADALWIQQEGYGARW
jgi:hypothetical protein